MKNICPVCGYDNLIDPAYREGVESFEICPSCGFQFGITDDDQGFSHEEWRQRWIRDGMNWNDTGPGGREKERPPNWNPVVQLLKIGVVVE